MKDIEEMTVVEIRQEIDTLHAQFNLEAWKYLDKGNKAAGARARKATLKLEKLYKAFRKATVNG